MRGTTANTIRWPRVKRGWAEALTLSILAAMERAQQFPCMNNHRAHGHVAKPAPRRLL